MLTLNIVIGERYYSKDPQSSELGRKIVSEGIELLAELGFESFTFKKLAHEIGSTEASIYRYFENKLKLLLYLTTLYWAWIEYLIDYNTHHLKDSEEKLREILKIICHLNDGAESMEFAGLNMKALQSVVDVESDKTYLTKEVDVINNAGLFRGYKGLCHKIAMVIRDINPDYKYPHALVSTVLEASHQQMFFALHLPSLTEVSRESDTSIEKQVHDFLLSTILKLIK